MNKVIQAYRFLNILSIDVAFGAVINAIFFAQIFHVDVKPSEIIALSLTVWIIYTIDHSVDAKKTKHTASSARHRFHQQHFKTLFNSVIVALLTDTVQLFFIHRQVIITGMLLTLFIVIYFFGQRYLKFTKELFGALLYCTGVLLVPLSLVNGTITTNQVLLLIQFFITVLINLLLFSLFGKLKDQQDKHKSLTTILDNRAVQTIISILFMISTALAALQIKENIYLVATFITLLMNMVLLVILLNKKYFELNDRYRLLGDVIFLLPVIYIITTWQS